jgi:hypothetical protein
MKNVYKIFPGIRGRDNLRDLIVDIIIIMKFFDIPVIIGATGIVSKSLQKYLETIPRQHSIDSLQKTAILGT